MSRQRPRDWMRVGNGLAVVATAVLLGYLGGLSGIAFGVVAGVSWVLGPPVFAFVLGQAGLAAIATPPYSWLVVATECALIAVLLTDSRIPWTIQSRGIGLLAAAGLTTGIWLAQPMALWSVAIGCLTLIAVLTYGVHRYELLVTAQLDS